MLFNPRLGQHVQVWYQAAVADFMPLHGKYGRITIVSQGKPRNHGVRIDGTVYAVPCGNLKSVKGALKG